MIVERRKVSYKEFEVAEIGYCLLITGGMMSPPIAIVERPDGTMAKVPIERVQFMDIPCWANLEADQAYRDGYQKGKILERNRGGRLSDGC